GQYPLRVHGQLLLAWGFSRRSDLGLRVSLGILLPFVVRGVGCVVVLRGVRLGVRCGHGNHSRVVCTSRAGTPRGGTLFYWFMKQVMVGPILRLLYRPWTRGVEHVPDEGGEIGRAHV